MTKTENEKLDLNMIDEILVPLATSQSFSIDSGWKINLLFLS